MRIGGDHNVVYIPALLPSLQFYGYHGKPNVAGSAYKDPEKGCGNSLNNLHPINVGANIYGVASCLAFLRMIWIFELHHRIGPILFCIKHVFWDILSIMGSYFITMLAFSVGLVSIFGRCADDHTKFPNFKSAFKRLFWIIFDPGKEEYTVIGPEENDAEVTTTQVTFARPFPRPTRPDGSDNNNFAKVGEDNTSLSHHFGIYIWGFYQIFVVIIMLNLLISLMTTTFARIQRNADIEWKFTRASTWIHYFDDSDAVPVPFNLIPSPYNLLAFFRWLTNWIACKKNRLSARKSTSLGQTYIAKKLM